MKNEEDEYIRQREFSRVDAHVPFEASMVPSEKQQNMRSRVSGQIDPVEYSNMADHEDKVLNDWLRMLDAKLNAVINMLSFQRDGFSALPFVNINISGAGIRYTSEQWYNKGDILEMKIMLPLMPPVALYLYGIVVNAEKLTNSYNIGVKFTNIDEDIQDLIVQFVFKKQRELLREKRK